MIGLRKPYRRWDPKAVAILEADWDRMVTFYVGRIDALAANPHNAIAGLRGSGKGLLEAILTT